MLESFSRHHSLELFVKQVQSEKYGSVVATSHALFTLLRVESVMNTNKLHDFPPEKLEAMSIEKSIDKLLAFLFSDSHSREFRSSNHQNFVNKFIRADIEFDDLVDRIPVLSPQSLDKPVVSDLVHLLGSFHSHKGHLLVYDRNFALQRATCRNDLVAIAYDAFEPHTKIVPPCLLAHFLGINLDHALACPPSVSFCTLPKTMAKLLVEHAQLTWYLC